MESPYMYCRYCILHTDDYNKLCNISVYSVHVCGIHHTFIILWNKNTSVYTSYMNKYEFEYLSKSCKFYSRNCRDMGGKSPFVFIFLWLKPSIYSWPELYINLLQGNSSTFPNPFMSRVQAFPLFYIKHILWWSISSLLQEDGS